MAKYTETFWLKAKRSCELCQLMTRPEKEVQALAANLPGFVRGYVKPWFAVIEYHFFILIAFRDDHDFAAGVHTAPFLDYWEECKRQLEKPELTGTKPVYFAGYGNAGVTAVHTARAEYVSGVFTFGLPEKVIFENRPRPFPPPAIYSSNPLMRSWQ